MCGKHDSYGSLHGYGFAGPVAEEGARIFAGEIGLLKERSSGRPQTAMGMLRLGGASPL